MKTTIQINGKDVEIELTPEQVAAIQATTETKTLWKPKEGEKYWIVTFCISSFLWTDSISDNLMYSTGHCYQTEEEAKKVYDRKIAEQKLKEIIFEANDGWTPDWNNENQFKYMFYYNAKDKKVYSANWWQTKYYPNWMYIKDDKTRNEIYEKHYDLLMQVYGCEN